MPPVGAVRFKYPNESVCLCCTGEEEKKQVESVFDGLEYLQEKDDDLHKSYNDRSYLSSEDVLPGESRTGKGVLAHGQNLLSILP